MKKRSMPDMKEGGVNVTPLIDIVMCLIIFFMLVAKIGVDTGADAAISVPPAFIGTNIADMGNTITLNVVNGPTGIASAEPIMTALVGNKTAELVLNDTGKGKPTLAATLKYYREGDPNLGIKANPDFKVIIRADKTVTFQFLYPILIEINKANIKTYAFATTPGQRPGSETEAPAAK
jgi:biopolymer transport protein ExbD